MIEKMKTQRISPQNQHDAKNFCSAKILQKPELSGVSKQKHSTKLDLFQIESRFKWKVTNG